MSLTSVSWVAAMSADVRAEKLAQIDALIRAGKTPAEVPVHLVIGLTTLA